MNSSATEIDVKNSKETLLELESLGTEQDRKVHVDHGETNCKTPDAAEYIRKAAKRRPA